MTWIKTLGKIGLQIEEWIDTLGYSIPEEEKKEEIKDKAPIPPQVPSYWTHLIPTIVGKEFPIETVIEVFKGEEWKRVSKVRWNGLAREEGQDKWLRNGWMPARLYIDGKLSSLLGGKIIECLALCKDEVHLNILTREAREEEKQWSRWPLIAESKE